MPFNHCAQFFFARSHESAIRVIDDHELLGPKQVVRYQERPKCVVGDDSAGVTDDMGIAVVEAKSVLGEARIHAGDDCKPARWTGREVTHLVRLGVFFIGLYDVVDGRHDEFFLSGTGALACDSAQLENRKRTVAGGCATRNGDYSFSFPLVLIQIGVPSNPKARRI